MKKKNLHKIDISNWYDISAFESTICWAEQYSNIFGINENITMLQKKKQEYSREMNDFLKQIQPAVDEKFAVWESAERKKNFCKWLSIGSFCVLLFCIFLSDAQIFHSYLILNILMFLFIMAMVLTLFVGGIAAVVLKIISNILQKKYNSYVYELECESRQIAAKYERGVSILRNKIDNLYLDSLEPAHREVVLMRRDQELQHQERMRIEQERLNSQKRMEEEQRKARQTQEELLHIEREREERYRKNRY